MALALVSSKRNKPSRAQIRIFTIENQHVLVQMAPQASWPPDVPAESLEAMQVSSARRPQPGFLGQESSKDCSARKFQTATSSNPFGKNVLQPATRNR